MPSETRPDTTIVDWHPRYGDAFGRLNREWLEKYFRVEAVDEPVLNDPGRHVLSPAAEKLPEAGYIRSPTVVWVQP